MDLKAFEGKRKVLHPSSVNSQGYGMIPIGQIGQISNKLQLTSEKKNMLTS